MRNEGLEEFINNQPQQPGDKQGISRRGMIQAGLAVGVTASMAAENLLHSGQVADAQQPSTTQATPIGQQWWPSKWGATDEAGASNWITPEKVLQTAKLIKTGKIYEMGRIANAGMPVLDNGVFCCEVLAVPRVAL